MTRLLPLALLSAGCATMFTGTTDTLSFDANIPGVRLSIDGRVEGELPLTLDMSRNFVGGKQFMAKFERAGYQTQQFALSREFNTVAILDVSSTIISGGVDVLTGSIMRFAPKEYHVQMVREGQAASARPLEAVRFALSNWRRLQTDLARGGGEYLDALSALAERPAPERLHAALAAQDAHGFARALGLF